MEINFTEDFVLTTHHPQSSYGAGALLYKGRAYGPADVLPDAANPVGAFLVAMVESGAHDLAPDEIKFINRFLSQDPLGRYAVG